MVFMRFWVNFGDNPELTMLKEERHSYILHQINLHNKILSSSLSEQIQVSEDTIRRDLLELAQEGKIIKVHGGALSKSFNPPTGSNGTVYAREEKRIIAGKALQFIKDGMFILTTGGTTITELARILPRELQATFITVSLSAATEFTNHPNIEVVILGDKLSRNSKITVGAETILKIQQIKADICFIGINAMDIEGGVMDNDWDVVQVKRAMIASAKKVIALSLSEKVQSFEPLKICNTDEIDVLITELEPDAAMLQHYKNKGIMIY